MQTFLDSLPLARETMIAASGESWDWQRTARRKPTTVRSDLEFYKLFWRSFLLRYLISSKFDSVPLGTFTPLSFLITVVLFGLEHDLWLAGMMAGATYTLLLYHTGRLWPCILAHGVTNFALGVHVLLTEEWKWW